MGMGIMGRPPKPTAIRVLEGNRSKTPLNEREPRPRTTRVHCPTWLDVEAKREWRRVIPELKRLGLMTIVDVAALAGYCQAYSRWQQAERVLTEKGLTMEIETKGGGMYEQQRPEVSIAQKYYALMMSTAAKFGFEPSSRSRLSVPGQREDELDALLS